MQSLLVSLRKELDIIENLSYEVALTKIGVVVGPCYSLRSCTQPVAKEIENFCQRQNTLSNKKIGLVFIERLVADSPVEDDIRYCYQSYFAKRFPQLIHEMCEPGHVLDVSLEFYEMLKRFKDENIYFPEFMDFLWMFIEEPNDMVRLQERKNSLCIMYIYRVHLNIFFESFGYLACLYHAFALVCTLVEMVGEEVARNTLKHQGRSYLISPVSLARLSCTPSSNNSANRKTATDSKNALPRWEPAVFMSDLRKTPQQKLAELVEKQDAIVKEITDGTIDDIVEGMDQVKVRYD